jgi:glycine/D-amino acid oxidase-like deaminating enzyme
VTADVVICGAGIAGVAAAWALAVQHGLRVLLVDERPPLSLTSDKSSEAYRNWWPGPDDAMVRFMNRSIDLLEAHAARTGNRFLMNRRGYLYATASPSTAERLLADARLAEAQGAGPVRVYRSAAEAAAYRPSAHTGWEGHPSGADCFMNPAAVRRQFPWMADDIVAVVHARRCGWFSGQQFGMLLLEEARGAGVTVLAGRVTRVETAGGRVAAVRVDAADGPSHAIATPAFVNAAGPYARDVGRLVGVELPLFSELHCKFAFEDEAGVFDRDTGLTILDDPLELDWDDDVRAAFAESDELRWLGGTFPPGIHFRPEGYHASRTVLLLWSYHQTHRYEAPVFPLPEDPYYPEVLMRGIARLVPGARRYVERVPRGYVDGGYYTKTGENRPLVGPLPVDGAYACAAFSGFGLMAAPAAAELLAAHVTGGALPPYEAAFRLSRYDDPAYRARLAAWGDGGQL